MRHHCFAVCAPGLEPLVADELFALGIRRTRPQTGGVTFDAATRQLYATNVWSRVATRVLVRVASFTARDFASLEHQMGLVDWDQFLARGGPVSLRVSSTGSRLYHTGAIEQRVRSALGATDESSGTDADQRIVVRVVSDRFTISLDSSGMPLYKRGWRHTGAKAPLRETLAAAMVLASGWTPGTPLIDPFSGSGTIAIEAACIAARRAPGAARSFAFEHWPSFEPGTYASVRADTHGDTNRSVATIVARDRDEGAITTTLENAARAGVSDLIYARRASVSELGEASSEAIGWIISNPPYGKRVSKGRDLRDLFARFGDVTRQSFGGWNVGLLVADTRAAGHARLPLAERFHTGNGGIPVRYLTGPVTPGA